MEARQSPFMHPSCREARATPRHESGDRAPCNPSSTRQRSANTRDGAGLSRGAVLGVHKKEECTESAKRNGENKKTAGKVRQVMNGGGFEVGALRGQGCTLSEV